MWYVGRVLHSILCLLVLLEASFLLVYYTSTNIRLDQKNPKTRDSASVVDRVIQLQHFVQSQQLG